MKLTGESKLIRTLRKIKRIDNAGIIREDDVIETI